MKKILVPILMILTVSAALADPPDEDVHRPYIPSRGQLYAQFDLGLNFSSLNGNDVARAPLAQLDGPTSIFESGSGLAPLFSASLGYDFNNMFGLAFRADLDMRSASNSGRTTDTCRLNDGFGGVIITPIAVDKEFSVDVNYLSFSLLGKVRFDQLYFFLGPTVSVPLSRDFTETDAIVDTASPCIFFPFTTDSSKTVTGSLTNSDNMLQRMSFKIGAGYMIPLTSKISLVPQIAYDFGLSDLFKDIEINTLGRPGAPATSTQLLPTAVNPAMRLSSLQATIGLRVNL